MKLNRTHGERCGAGLVGAAVGTAAVGPVGGLAGATFSIWVGLVNSREPQYLST